MTKQTTKTETATSGDAAAQIGMQSEALKNAKRKLFEAVTEINALLGETYAAETAARAISTETWLDAVHKYESANRARDHVEYAIGHLNNISKGE